MVLYRIQFGFQRERRNILGRWSTRWIQRCIGPASTRDQWSSTSYRLCHISDGEPSLFVPNGIRTDGTDVRRARTRHSARSRRRAKSNATCLDLHLLLDHPRLRPHCALGMELERMGSKVGCSRLYVCIFPHHASKTESDLQTPEEDLLKSHPVQLDSHTLTLSANDEDGEPIESFLSLPTSVKSSLVQSSSGLVGSDSTVVHVSLVLSRQH